MKWPLLPFDEVIADESGGNTKTPQSEFLERGRYAIVDQGKDLIAGYTDDQSRLCRAQLPVIVFGDHTRIFKYIDFPFCMGADGVKVLRPKIEADTKFLFHYLRQVKLTEAGYDRHFKYLKRTKVVFPPLPEQRRIAEILDKADALRAKRRAAIAQLDTLTQSIFIDMFGDPATNPKGWDLRTVGHAADIVVVVPTRDKPSGFSGDIPWVTLPDLDGLYIDQARHRLSESEARAVGNRVIPTRSVLLSCAATLGRVAITQRPVYANQQFYGLIPRQDLVTPEYLALCLLARSERFFNLLGGIHHLVLQ